MLEDLIKFRDVSKVLSILKEGGGCSRFVGGCVRDSILGLQANDVDIATTLLPDEVDILLKVHNIKTLDVGKDHGTIIAIVNSYPYEITSLRKDVSTDGRRAVVEYSSDWCEDAARRDFTFNAMSYDPYEDKLYDYFNGKEDLEKGIVRFVGNPEERVQEDYLRILRFFRFYAYCATSDKVDIKSLEACKKYAFKINTLSPERKFQELIKILNHNNVAATVRLMQESGILEALFERDVFGINFIDHISEICAERGHSVSGLINLFAISNVNKISFSQMNNLFHMSNKDLQYLKKLELLVSSGIKNITSNIYKYVYEYPNYVIDALIYLEAIGEESKAHIEQASSILLKREAFPITGDDIIKSFNIKEGKGVGELLDSGKEIWYKSKCKASKQEILSKLKSRKAI